MPASSFILPAQSLHTHSAVFIPNYPGDIIIKGCTIRFSACKKRNFAFYSPRSRRDKELWYDERNGEIKVKQIGTSPQKSTIADEPAEDDTSQLDGFWRRRTLSVTILPPQPVLVLESIVLQDSALMLLEGER
jgi:trafficking protein particle complex subunit 9